MIARINYKGTAEPKDFAISVPGWVYKVRKIFYAQPEIEVVNEPLKRIRTKFVELNQLAAFGSIIHKLNK